MHYRRPGGIIVVVERQLGQAGDGIFLGDGGLAAEDFDLGFERRGERDAAAGSFDVVECLFRIAVLPAKSKEEDCQPTENIKRSIESFLHTLIPIISGLPRRAAAAAVVC